MGGPLQRRKWGPDWIAPEDYTINHGNGILVFSQPGQSSRTVSCLAIPQPLWPRVLACGGRGDFPTISILAYGGCVPTSGVNQRGATGLQALGMRRDHRTALAYARTPEVKTIVISAWWELYRRPDGIPLLDSCSVPLCQGDPRLFEKGLRRARHDVASLVASGKRVYLVLPSPPSTQFRSQMAAAHRPRRAMNRIGLSRDLFDQQTAWVGAHLRNVAERSGAKLIDPSEVLCSGHVCPMLTSKQNARLSG